MKTIISSFLIIGGIILMAGSAGDCDGKCVENSNTIAEMLMYAGMGLTLFLTGAIVAIKQ
jgi:hypothetical protein